MVPGPHPNPEAIREGIVRYCDARLQDIEQDHRAIVWRGTRAFIAAAVALVVVIWLSKSVYEAGNLAREVLSEGLSIAGWVALWIPFELLSFQLWDHHLDKRTYRQLSDLSLRVETTPAEQA